MAKKRIKDSATLTGWRKSSHSGSQGGGCVEVVDGFSGGVPVRDSKDAHGPAFVVSDAGWSAFVNATKSGAFSA
ncbi:DUF397 domain-containing protein [Streptomyces sp. NPDC048142]|uniref:DUF397 domain-containing protein n=1 Tax=Streptomyces sp. NPDC048142 TaxID=3365501 RepID=UPI003713518C